MKKYMVADLIKDIAPLPGDMQDIGQDNIIDLSPVGIATYAYEPEHDVYIVTLKLNKDGEEMEYVLSQEGLIDLIELGTKYFYNEMESATEGRMW